MKERKKTEAGMHAVAGEPPDEVLRKISESFRTFGFEGASLARISEATGLIKASLYHRFPGGKEQIAEAVLESIDRHFAEHVLRPVDESGPVAERLQKICKRLRAFYADGQSPCLLDTLTLGDSPPAVLKHARASLDFWVEKFAQFARENGLGKSSSRLAAEDAVAALEGGLIISRVTGKPDAFRRAIDSLGGRLGILSRDRS